jgi:exopolysaccharide biosynthesis protein
MSVYKIPRKIKRFEIFQPRMTLKNWYNKQTDKPDILFNASLYTSTNKPCGTIWNDGVMVSDQGNGFGFGTMDKKTVEFGSPYNRKWYDYLTGYYGLVQNGQAIDPPWKDSYVFDKALTRIAFGQMNDGTLAVFCEDGKTIKTFAANAVKQGFKNLCNLDGGGSRALLWMGKWVYTSTRTPYNAIAIWLEDDVKAPSTTTSNDKIDGLQVKCTKKTFVYNKNGKLEIGRSISSGDICIINETITDNLLIQIEYPVSSGTRIAYIKSVENFIAI